MPFGSFHWWDLLPLLFMIVVVGGGLVLLGRSIGKGYARERHRLERRDEQQ